jgi:5'-nucleotidase
VSDVVVAGQPLDPAKTYTVAITDYQILGGDGYDMLPKQKVLVGPEGGPLIVTALEKYVTARRTVNPAKEGRIAILR